MSVTMNSTAFWDVMQSCSYKNGILGGIYRHHHKGTRIGKLGTLAVTSSVLRLLVIANAVPISPILVTLMMEVICSAKTSVLTKDTQCYILGDGSIHMQLLLSGYFVGCKTTLWTSTIYILPPTLHPLQVNNLKITTVRFQQHCKIPNVRCSPISKPLLTQVHASSATILYLPYILKGSDDGV
jgi:hypothetical protein